MQEVNVGYRRACLLGINSEKLYIIDGHEYYGDELMNVGLITTDESFGENHSNFDNYRLRLYIIKGK